jgi:signal peptidase I
MRIKEALKNFWEYLKRDTWDSWVVSLILVVLFIKLIFFPGLSLITGASLPLVVVESCSMYHSSDFDDWWNRNAAWYDTKNITKNEFESFSFQNGLNKGDVILIWGRAEYKKGDIIIFRAPTKNPIIHRAISEGNISTKGDHNIDQLPFEKEIQNELIIGKAAGRIPFVGWLKLIFFEPIRPEAERGLCS